jgi:hypothetical protein
MDLVVCSLSARFFFTGPDDAALLLLQLDLNPLLY